MFRYTVPVESLLNREDRRIYRNYYCDTCHHLRDDYGYVSTLTVNYEMTFMNLFFNSIFDDGIIPDGKPGGVFCIFRKTRTDTELIRAVTAYTVLVANNSLLDDVADDPNSMKGKLGLLGLNPAIKGAVKKYPEYNDMILYGYEKLREAERTGEKDPFVMGRLSSQSMIDVLRAMLGTKFDCDIEGLFRAFGVWVYVMDAIEDLEDDYKDGTYNPFLIGRDGFVGKRKFIRDNIFDIGGTMGKAIGDIQTQYLKIRPKLLRNQNILDNIVYQGVPYSAHRIVRGDKMDLTCRNVINGKLTRGQPVSL